MDYTESPTMYHNVKLDVIGKIHKIQYSAKTKGPFDGILIMCINLKVKIVFKLWKNLQMLQKIICWCS